VGVIGEAQKCHSCGEQALVLEQKPLGFYIVCLNCGFRELAWKTTEPAVKLRRLLERFKVNPLTLTPCFRALLLHDLWEVVCGG
jgi:DNA-directed RNA polymerase subunit RPC12/RpoP